MEMKPERKEQKELRSFDDVPNDSADSIRRAGGEDPRRYDAKIMIDRAVRDNDMSGYNHNATSSQPSNGGHENEMYMAMKDREVASMGSIEPDGIFRR
jgi:hypothetical protein